MTRRDIRVRHVSKIFGGTTPVPALAPIDLDICGDEFTSILGPSGCGKSTLLSIIAGLQEPSDGSVVVDGAEVMGPGRERGLVFQSHMLFPWLTVQKNVEFALRGEKTSRRERTARAREYLAMVGLEPFRNAYPRQLSGGMKQRVAIARALSYQPSVLLMDEPFAALDAQTRRLMQELLTRVWEKRRLTVLFVTHDIDEAIYLSDRVLVMTARPGAIKKDIAIDLPRPRDAGLLIESGFADYRGTLLAAIRDESIKAAEFTEP